MFAEQLEKALDRGRELEPIDLRALLAAAKDPEVDALHAAAYRVKEREVGCTVFFRGLIEISNICRKDCLYCGIRRSNENLQRYCMGEEEIVQAACWAHENDYGSIVLQSGEQQSADFTALIERVLIALRERTRGELGVTLSLGEQDEETYQRWRDAGARRYLLRIETSDPLLYKQLHPPNHSFEQRRACLGMLRSLGYQVGTGVMIGLPGQSLDSLVGDLLFFREMDIDMIGMGPYIPHQDTPMADAFGSWDDRKKQEQLRLALNMIAVARLFLRDVNLAATTALQALDPQGREKGLLAGANIVMPNVTDVRYRASYQLYSDKPCLDENSGMCRACLSRRIASIGEQIGFGQHGDSPHWKRRIADRRP